MKLKTLLALAVIAGWSSIAGNAARAETDHTDIPLHFDGDGRPAAEVLINGEGPLIFAIDTAATASSVSKPILDKLGVKPDPHRRAMVHGAGGVTETPLYRIESIRIGGVVREGLYLITSPAEHDDTAHDGLIGADVFRNTNMEFDFSGKRFSLDAETPFFEENDYDLASAEIKFGSLAVVNIRINGVETAALIDTGAQETIANKALLSALRRSVEDAGMMQKEETMGATAHAVEVFEGFKGNVQLGKAVIENAPIKIADLHVFEQLAIDSGPAVILGMDVMSKLGGLVIDYPAETVKFRAK